MNKADFNRANKYLKNKIPHYEFELSEKGRLYRPDASGSDGDFVEISVDTLFDIVNDLFSTKDRKNNFFKK